MRESHRERCSAVLRVELAADQACRPGLATSHGEPARLQLSARFACVSNRTRWTRTATGHAHSDGHQHGDSDADAKPDSDTDRHGDCGADVHSTQTPIPLPTNTDQCKNDGWQTFGMFKNQGDYVSFVATRGKNPPAGP